jgi:hypothetical protein
MTAADGAILAVRVCMGLKIVLSIWLISTINAPGIICSVRKLRG